MILLPLLVLILLTHRLARTADLRTSVVWATVVLGVFIAVTTEALSAVNLVTRMGVGACWGALALALALVEGPALARRATAARMPGLLDLRTRIRGEPLEASLVAAMVALAALVVTNALVSPPNTWDAMDYHMTRVAMWIQHANVRLFTTPDYSHDVFAPWAEYALLHLDLLGGGDRFVNLVEAWSMVASALGASLIARELGAAARGQVLAGFLVVALPEGILEASGAMNTFVVSLWITLACLFLLRFGRAPTLANALTSAACVGLAVLTKGSAYAYLPPLLLAAWWVGSRQSRTRLLAFTPVLALTVLALNAPQALRELDFTGSPLGLPFPQGGIRLHWSNDHVSLGGTFSNMLRNASLHCVLPFGAWNDLLEKAVRAVLRALTIDPDDTATTWLETQWFKGYHLPPAWLQRHEVFTGNVPEFLLACVAAMLLLLDRRAAYSRQTKVFAAGVLGAFALYCALLRWQIWGARHQLPLFVVGAAILGVVFAQRLSRTALAAVAALAFVWALNCALRNSLRPLLARSGGALTEPRAEQYFADQHREIADSWIAAAQSVHQSSCREVGIDEGEHYFVYPLLALLGADSKAVHVQYVGVNNLTSRYQPADAPNPCVVVCLHCAPEDERTALYSATLGEARAFGDLQVYGLTRSPTPTL